MYKKNLQIIVFSKNSSFTEFLKAVKPQPEFSHVFLPEQADFSAAACAEADIVLLDLPLTEIPLTVREACQRPGARIVFCDRLQDEALETSELLEVLDAIWPPPLDAVRVGFFFRRLLKEIGQSKELWMQRNLLDTIIDSMPDLVWIKDIRGAHLKVNQGFCELVGKTKEQCEGRGHYFIWDIDPEDYSKGEFVCLESEEQVMNARKTCYFDEKIKGPNGRMMQFGTYKSPVFDERGELVGTLGVARNVTDWRNINVKVDIILSALDEAAMVLNAEGEILSVNKAWRELFHQNADAVQGQPYAEWKDAVLHTRPLLKPNTRAGIVYQNGHDHCDLELAEEPILDIFGQLIGYFCLFHDVTEHKRHLQLSAKYQKELEAAVRLKTRTIQDIQKKAYVSFADIINSRDPSTADHLRNTSWFAELLLEEMKREQRYPELKDEEYCDAILRSVPMHDVGKILLPDDVLHKKGTYTSEEFQTMTRHTVEGKKIIDKTIGQVETFKFYKVASDMTASHHERWDGKGYPKGLAGKAIPLAARIMAVADVFDALVSPRSYHPTKTIDQAYVVIKAIAGTQLDPEVAAAFIIARPAVEKLMQEKIYHIR